MAGQINHRGAMKRRERVRNVPGEGRLRFHCRLDLASVFVAQHDIGRAVQQLREAAKSSDPEVARLAAGALQRLGER